MSSTGDGDRPLVFMDERGRVTIPKEIREGLTASQFRIGITDGGGVELEPAKIVSGGAAQD